MSFLFSMKQLVSGAGQSINEGARKLVSSMSQDSTGTSGSINDMPNIEVSEDLCEPTVDGHQKKRVAPSPEMVASMPLSSGVHFSRRRPSLGLNPTCVSSAGKRSPFALTLEAPANNLNVG